jgi:uncharacterized protein (TIGR03435 family)
MRAPGIIRTAVGTLLLILAGTANSGIAPSYGQSAAPNSVSPKFAVASIRRNPKPAGMRLQFTVDGLWTEGVTLRQLIQMAYGVFGNDRLTGESDWVDTDYFDVEAKVDDSLAGHFEDLSMAQRRSMLQSLLADRFGLVVHRANAERPVYNLVIAEGGPKLKTTDPSDIYHSEVRGYDGLITRSNRGLLEVEGFSMDALATHLGTQGIVDRPVANCTGLTGSYSFSLHWAPGDLTNRPDLGPSQPQGGFVPSDPPGASTIYTEIQKQLGLKLQPSKGQVEILVVDHAAAPTPN